MFNHSPTVILYLKWNSLELYRESRKIASLEFPVEIVNHIEILDQEAFLKLLTVFFEKQPIVKEEAVLLLEEKVTFYKAIPKSKDNKGISRDVILSFFESVPFGSEIIGKKIIQTPEGLQLFAVNKKFIETIKEVYEQKEGKIHTASSDVFFDNKSESLSPVVLNQIQQNINKLEQVNFLDDDFEKILQKIAPDKEYANQPNSSHRKPGLKKQFITLAVICMVFIGAIVFALVQTGVIKMPKSEKKIVKSQVKPTIILTPKKEETNSSASANLKKAMKVQILNGSGIEGQAGKIKEQLQKIGYEDFELGNATTTSTESALFVSPNINQSTFEELFSSLSTIVPGKININKTDTPAFDIIIITGEK